MNPLDNSIRFQISKLFFQTYYDIFVRHAFGNYRDILKEVSYSPMMGEMLTYRDSRSTTYLYRTRSRVEFADENYAREIMQVRQTSISKFLVLSQFFSSSLPLDSIN